MAKKTYVYDGTAWQDLASSVTDLSAYYTKTQSDSNFVNVSGDTMTGNLYAPYIDSSGPIAGTTQAAAGRGVLIRQPAGDATDAILQFTNNAVTAQRASINATASGDLTLNPSSGNVYANGRPIPYATSAGSTTGAALAAGTGTSVTVTFSTASRFTQAPLCFNSFWSNGYNASSASSSGTTGILLRAWNPSAVTQTAGTHQWFAIQMLSSSAASS